MPTYNLRRILALSAVASLAACAQNDGARPTGPAVAYDPAIRTEVEQQIAQSSARAANALETLAMIQRARTAPAAPALDESGLPEELRRKTTIAFQGPADEAARSLAEQIGYGFVVTGNPPANPGLVSLDEHDVSVAKALEDLGLQAQRFATVVVDPNLRRVEFRNETVPDAIEAPKAEAPHAPAPAAAHRHRVARTHPARAAAAVACGHCPAPATAKEAAAEATKLAAPMPTVQLPSTTTPDVQVKVAPAAPAAVPAAAPAPLPPPTAGAAPAVPALPPGMVPVAPANF
jgi:defect-in-organelle-trafficking protein DotD